MLVTRLVTRPQKATLSKVSFNEKPNFSSCVWGHVELLSLPPLLHAASPRYCHDGGQGLLPPAQCFAQEVWEGVLRRCVLLTLRRQSQRASSSPFILLWAANPQTLQSKCDGVSRITSWALVWLHGRIKS